MKYIKEINSFGIKTRVGNKAKSLIYLHKKNFKIPKTFVVLTSTKEKFEEKPELVKEILIREISIQLNPGNSYAVRSSSDIEDSSEHSFAGQFSSYLNITGTENIFNHIIKVWQSAEEVAKSNYFKSLNYSGKGIRIGVILQEMVDASWSGIAFSVNPVSGREEIIIEGIKGIGEDLIQKGIKPNRWTFAQGKWIEFDENNSIDLHMLEKLVSEIKRLKKQTGSHIDIEWLISNNELLFIQCRPVTTHKYPNIYSNHISREFLPGLIKPLVWSVNIPLVNSAWIKLLEELLGKLKISPEQLSHSFYYRAYFNMGTMGNLFDKMGLPRNSLESLMGRKDPSGKSAFKPSIKVARYLPRMLWFVLSKITIGKQFERKIKTFVVEYNRLHTLVEKEFLIENYEDLFNQIMSLSKKAAYFNIIMPLLMQIFNKSLKKKLDKKNILYEQLEFETAVPEIRDYNPAFWLKKLASQWNEIPDDEKDIFRNNLAENKKAPSSSDSFHSSFSAFISKFGHFSESGNDFSYKPWQENPAFILSQIENKAKHSADKSANKKKKITRTELKKNGVIKTFLKAGRYQLYREKISSEYTKIYGLFHILFLKSANYLVKSEKLASIDDVFMLYLEEHNRLLHETDTIRMEEILNKINKRKNEMKKYQDISLPSVIYGEVPPPVVSLQETIYKGIPISSGIFEGKIVVVKGYEDFKKDIKNAILVIPFSDVGWTPLLTQARAIISESGGILSHASIIAREMSIPAVASVDNVCKLKDGTFAKVDGNNGILTIIK